jgi:predicted dehydrogenase
MGTIERRTFLNSVAAGSAFTILKPGIAFGSKANSAISVGIIGCGGRGTTVISEMATKANIQIQAMADLFEDKLLTAKGKINRLNALNGFPEVKASHTYLGSEAYLHLLDNKGLDAVLISSPAYTHPGFMEAAVERGKHVYCEKPVATDVEGCARVERLGPGTAHKVSIVIGFQIRTATPYVEMVKRIQRGDIGEIITVQLFYLSSGVPWKESDIASYSEAQIRNHYHFRALSGGILLDQGIHMLDVSNWALQSHPLSAMGTGGRKGRSGLGDAWSNYQVLYSYPGMINASIHSTQIGPSFGDVCARFTGTRGIAEAHYTGGVFIQGDHEWDSGILRGRTKGSSSAQRIAGVFDSALHDSTTNKVRAFINSIETGAYLNETKTASESTLTAIMGREAATSGREVTWDDICSSNELPVQQ